MAVQDLVSSARPPASEFGTSLSEEKMSRMHDALKKAAKERSTQISSSADEGVEIAAELPRPVVAEPSLLRLSDQSRISVAERHEGSLQYETLIKRCAHPTWRLNSLSNVF